MKLKGMGISDEQIESLPARGAWIEMDFVPLYDEDNGASLPARGAWIEIHCVIKK